MKNRPIIWITCIITGIGLSMILFDLMPSLIKRNPERLDLPARYVNLVNVIRIRTPESHINKRKEKMVQKNEPRKLASKRIYLSPGMKIKQDLDIELPFEIKTKLPNALKAIPVKPTTRLGLNSFGLTGPFAIGEVDYPPIPISQLPPVYPLYAKMKGIEGWVMVRFIVNEKGMVEHIDIIKSHPKGIFDDAVVNCVSKWRFRPATVEGINVKTLVQTTIHFKLK